MIDEGGKKKGIGGGGRSGSSETFRVRNEILTHPTVATRRNENKTSDNKTNNNKNNNNNEQRTTTTTKRNERNVAPRIYR